MRAGKFLKETMSKEIKKETLKSTRNAVEIVPT